MKLVRLACIACLVLVARAAAGQEYPSIMEIRPQSQYEEVAQATKPSTTLAPPVTRGTTPRQTPAPATPSVVASNGPSVPPEMWLYSEQLRRHDDPAQAVRRKAELRGSQRMTRIAAMKWFGFSNSRPQANPIPMTGGYSPVWVGNGEDRYDWVGVSWHATPVLVENYNYDLRR